MQFGEEQASEKRVGDKRSQLYVNRGADHYVYMAMPCA